MRAVGPLSLLLFCVAMTDGSAAQTVANGSAESASQPGRDGVIAGRVVNDVGRPVAGAQILAVKAGVKIASNMQFSTTDDEGAFNVSGLGPGSYMISTNVPGYVVARPDFDRDYHRPGENVTINLIKGGVITGRVTDSYGDPMAGVRVEAINVRKLEDGRKYSKGFWGSQNYRRLTDDRGVYRLYGLEPGVYVVGVSGNRLGLRRGLYAGREAITWHPSSARVTAAEITVRSGEEAAGIDIRHREEQGYTISGKLFSETGSGSIGEDINIMLTSAAGGQLIGMGATYGTKSFVASGVPDGEYEIVAFRASYRDSDFASSPPRRVVVKGADVTGIELKLAPPASISGRVRIENPFASAIKKTCDDGIESKDRAAIGDVLLSAAAEDERRPSIVSTAPFFSYMDAVMGGAPDEKGAFTLNGLAAGRFRIKADLPDKSWYVRAITQPAAGAAKKTTDASRNGIAVKTGEKLSGVELVIAEGAASLNGRVVPVNEGAGLPSRIRIHLIPAEVSAADDVLRYAETALRGDGAFEFKHLAPGKYLLFARQTTEKESNDEQARPAAWNAAERMKLLHEAEAAKNEIELGACDRVKDHKLIYGSARGDARD